MVYKDPLKAIEKLQDEKAALEKHVESLEARQLEHFAEIYLRRRKAA